MSEQTHDATSCDDGSQRDLITRWQAIIAEFQRPSPGRATWQIVNTVGSYVALWVLMYYSQSVSWWLTVALAILAAGFLVRVFIIFHDCGHGSFFRSRRANDTWGFIMGVLTFTPYHHWRWEHAIHHATAGDLDRRSVGDIWTMTVDEYLGSSRWRRFDYRLNRNPVFLFLIAPLIHFLIRQRFPSSNSRPRERHSVWMMNAAIVALAAGLIAIFGFVPWLIIQFTTMTLASSAGIWLFYVQHQFEGAYWERERDWDYTAAALRGSTYYKLPRVLQWFSGNIGFHHVHYLSPRIPNYNLERCHRSDPLFDQVEPTTLLGSLKTMSYRLWDENARKLISFAQLKKDLRQAANRQDVSA